MWYCHYFSLKYGAVSSEMKMAYVVNVYSILLI